MKYIKNLKIFSFITVIASVFISCDETLETDATIPQEITLEIKATDDSNFNILQTVDSEGSLIENSTFSVPKSFVARSKNDIIYTVSDFSQQQGREDGDRQLNNRNASIVFGDLGPQNAPVETGIIGELRIKDLSSGAVSHKWTVVGLVDNINGQRVDAVTQEALFATVLDHFDVFDADGNPITINSRPATTIELGLYGTTVEAGEDIDKNGRVNGSDTIFVERTVFDFGENLNEIVLRAKKLTKTDDDENFKFIIQLEVEFESGVIDRKTMEIGIVKPGTTTALISS